MIDYRSGLLVSVLIACVCIAGCVSAPDDRSSAIGTESAASAVPSEPADPPTSPGTPTTDGGSDGKTVDASVEMASASGPRKPAEAKNAANPAIKSPDAAPARIQWVKDWDTAKKTAAKTGKLIMVDFYTDWCGWCKKLDRDTYTDKNVIRLSTEFVPVKLNAGKAGKTLARKNGVRGYPTILFFDAKEKVVGRIAGYLPPDKYTTAVKNIQEKNRKAPSPKS
ncbi:MAG: thioredoxin family protein [Phycisphaerae bacterium]